MSIPPSPAAVATAARSPVDEAMEILACRTTGERIGDFLRERVPGLVVDTISGALDGDIGPIRCTVTRSKLKPHRRLTVSAELHGLGPGPRPLTAIWGAAPAAFTDGSRDPVVPLEARRPFTRLRVADPEESAIGPRLLVAPLDPAFPALATVHDRQHLAGVLRSTGITVAPAELTVVALRFRPGQRHVLRLDLEGSGRSIFAKCYRDDAGARVAGARSRVAAILAAWGGPAAAVQPVGYVESDRLMLWEGSAGVTLGHLVDRSFQRDRDLEHDRSLEHVRTAGAALRAIHDAPVAEVDRSRRSDPSREGAATLRSCEHVTALLPGREETMVELVADTVRRLTADSAETGHLLHGDYKCDNILVEGERLRLLDLDRVTVGDPALDVGKMTADLRWWASTNGMDVTPLLDAFLDGYGACPAHRLLRADRYDDIFMLRSVGRRIPLHEPGWTGRVERMLADIADTAVTR